MLKSIKEVEENNEPIKNSINENEDKKNFNNELKIEYNKMLGIEFFNKNNLIFEFNFII